MTTVFALREGRVGGGYAVAMVNLALQNFALRGEFPWHLQLNVQLQAVNRDGLPTFEEAELLNRFEDQVAEALGRDQQLHFVARETRRGVRVIHWYLVDPEPAARALRRMIDGKTYERELEFTIRFDPQWREVEWLLQSP
jgi:hypothetical protein